MIAAADVESKRAQRKVRATSASLEADDEDMLLREDERRELKRELSVLEVLYCQYIQVY